MGHIDHGKSTLLDYIRKTNIVATEAGGITQHISAYEVTHKDASGTEARITFLDTPGHAAFQGMRRRGAHVADVAILVVSAEDGVKEQTMEAYRAIIQSKTPYIVAINKIDKPHANVERTKQTLAEKDIYLEGWGGDVPWVAISAKTGQGVSDLLDTLLLVAEMEELTGDRNLPGEGVIIESNMDPKKGSSATIVLTNGTIEKGSYVVAEDSWAPLRIMEDFTGKAISIASFSSPLRVTGWSGVPKVGAMVKTVETKKEAENMAVLAMDKTITGDIDNVPDGVMLVIPIVIKADTLGTLEALIGEVSKVSTERARLRIVGSGVGTVTENDVTLVSGKPVERPIVLGFRVGIDPLASDLAERQNVVVEMFDVIYKLTEWLSEELAARNPKVATCETLGALKVLRCFSQQKDRQVIGGRVENGKLEKGAHVKIFRKDKEIGEGEVIELQCQKIAALEVGEGTECGLSVSSLETILERDMLVPYITVNK